MKTLKMKLVYALIAAMVLFSACSDDDGDGNPTAPQLPPQESMSANMGDFPSNGESSQANANGDKSHFTFAAGNVIFWQTLLNVQLAIPVASFQEAFNHSFEYLEAQGRWKSEYSVEVGNKNITATLYAERTDDEIEWEMYLTLPGQFENYLWFSGESELDNSGGTWVLYRSPSEPRPLLEIEWEREDGEAINSTYTLIDTQADKNGSYIQYGLTSETRFTHYYQVSITSQSEDDYDALIYYNQETRVGSVQSTSHFGDDAFRCWDSNFNNTDCGN